MLSARCHALSSKCICSEAAGASHPLPGGGGQGLNGFYDPTNGVWTTEPNGRAPERPGVPSLGRHDSKSPDRACEPRQRNLEKRGRKGAAGARRQERPGPARPRGPVEVAQRRTPFIPLRLALAPSAVINAACIVPALRRIQRAARRQQSAGERQTGSAGGRAGDTNRPRRQARGPGAAKGGWRRAWCRNAAEARSGAHRPAGPGADSPRSCSRLDAARRPERGAALRACHQ